MTSVLTTYNIRNRRKWRHAMVGRFICSNIDAKLGYATILGNPGRAYDFED